jgi:hypothetical protein
MKDKKLEKWRVEKKLKGWRTYHLMCPEPLIKELKECVRQWKFKNPEYYERS